MYSDIFFTFLYSHHDMDFIQPIENVAAPLQRQIKHPIMVANFSLCSLRHLFRSATHMLTVPLEEVAFNKVYKWHTVPQPWKI